MYDYLYIFTTYLWYEAFAMNNETNTYFLISYVLVWFTKS